MLTRKEAEKAGKELLGRMKGEGWTLRVWENLGWQYCVRNGPATVYPTHDGRFHCLLADEKLSQDSCGFGASAWTTKEVRDDPNDAVAVELQCARDYANRVNRALACIESRLNPPPEVK